MPLRPFSRDQAWLLPPTLDELLPADHPVRFIAAVVDALDHEAWLGLGVDLEGTAAGDGAAAYHPRVLLGVWLQGFMTGVRSTRKLEAACREQLPYLWLSGRQVPDHNTLWRFYQGHRQQMRRLFKRTVRAAVRLGLVDLAVQAIDGTKIAANAAKDQSLDAKGLGKLLARTEQAIADLEAQNTGGGDEGGAGAPPRLPEGLREAQERRERVQAALVQVQAEEGPARVNLTDGAAGLMKGRNGIVAGYHAQAVVSPLDPAVAGRSGLVLVLTAAAVTTQAHDYGQLTPMLAAAEESTGQRAALSLLDGGYHSGATLAVCAERGQRVLLPEAQQQALRGPYHKDRFAYDEERDQYTCPEGQTLRFGGMKRRQGHPEVEVRVYRVAPAACRSCPAFGKCTKNRRHGRTLEVGPEDRLLREHRARMQRPEAKAAYRRRQEMVELGFGIVKEQQGARRFLLRGLANVAAEWSLLATAFNLRTLYRVWQRWTGGQRQALVTALGCG